MIGICSMLHMLVDGLCMCGCFLMSLMIGYDSIVIALIVYNVMAFVTQPFTGILADRLHHRHWLLLASCLLLSLASLGILFMAFLTSLWSMIAVAILLGLGNSCFHVWGGKQTAVTTGNDMRALGVFVSTGAFGLAIGMLFCSFSLLYLFLLAIIFLSAIYLVRDSRLEEPQPTEESSALRLPLAVAAILALMAFVMMRSLVSESFSSIIPRTDNAILLIGFVAMAGKMAGGWIARQLGIVLALVLMLACTLVCFLARDYGQACLLAGLFAINCTMPVTLYLANVALKGKEGLAFGLLAAALIPGYILAFI